MESEFMYPKLLAEIGIVSPDCGHLDWDPRVGGQRRIVISD